MDDRKQFLVQMYNQMLNDINTHILVVWQSVGVVVGAFAVFALVEKSIIPLDVAAALQVALCAWLIANLYDSSYWYNRNLVIIANIEREFLQDSDLRQIHYYFGKHRSKSAMLTHLRIQWWLGFFLALLFLVYHFLVRVVPGMKGNWSSFDPLRTLPYLTAGVALFLLTKLRANRVHAYEEFLRNSPGREVTTRGIHYGIGHPTDPDASPAKSRDTE